MSNGIASRLLPAAFAAILLLSGCARDRASHGGVATTNAHGNVEIAQQAVANSGNVVQHKLCPVTGEPLESMGGAIPVTVQGQTVFVCCQGCVKKVKSDPDKYLAIAKSE